MARYVALLRAVNVGGSTRLGMAGLRDLLGDTGLTEVQTLLQSGNVVFSSPVRPAAQLEGQLNDLVRRSFGPRTEVYLRTAGEWREIVERNPFPQTARDDPAHLVVTVLRTAPSASAWAALDRAVVGREQVRGDGRQAYIVYPDGIGRSRLTADVIERALQTSGTSRNWNTTRKLAALLGS